MGTIDMAFRLDAIEKVRGVSKFAADYDMPGMLHIKTFWTEKIYAKLISLDVSEAERMPGVVRVITAKDIKGTNLANIFEPYDRPVLVEVGQNVEFAGDSLALVVAETELQAEEALKKIHAVYEPYEGPYTMEDIHNKNTPAYFSQAFKKDDVEKWLEKSDVIVEETFHIPSGEHAYIETECGIAYIDGSGIVNLIFGTQNPARHHRMLSKSLGLSNTDIRIISPYVGGAFGGKHSISVQNHLVLAALVTHRPVKLVWTREESFFASCKRQKIDCTWKLGLSSEGKILASKLEVEAIGAPYTGYAIATLVDTIWYTLGCYYGESMLGEVKLYHGCLNEFGAFRGFGATEGTYMVEVMMDEAAHALGLDPYDFRMMNLIRKDQIETQYDDCPWMLTSKDITAKEVLDKALLLAGEPPAPSTGMKAGRGIAIGMGMYGVGDQRGSRGSSVDLKLFYDGSAMVRVGIPEIGSGITGVVVNIVKEELGLPAESIKVLYGDSHTAPRHGSLGFSQATVNCGAATIDACNKLRASIEKEAQRYLRTEAPIRYHANTLTFQNGEEAIPFDTFLYDAYLDGLNFAVTGWFRGYDVRNRAAITFIGGVADVEVDEETGEVFVRNLVNVHDCGKVINYISARGQLLGGSLMSYGLTMNEEFVMENGRPKTRNLAEYLIPTSMDLPDRHVAGFVESPAKIGPYGAKGIGEHSLYVTPPAISNAIYNATGIRMTDFPFTPEKILRKMRKIK